MSSEKKDAMSIAFTYCGIDWIVFSGNADNEERNKLNRLNSLIDNNALTLTFCGSGFYGICYLWY